MLTAGINWNTRVHDEKTRWYHLKGTVGFTRSTTFVRTDGLGKSGYGLLQLLTYSKGATYCQIRYKGSSTIEDVCKIARKGDILQFNKGEHKANCHSYLVTGREKMSNGKYDLKISAHSGNRLNDSFRKEVNSAAVVDGLYEYTIIKSSEI